jgi:hypothetical protein
VGDETSITYKYIASFHSKTTGNAAEIRLVMNFEIHGMGCCLHHGKAY